MANNIITTSLVVSLTSPDAAGELSGILKAEVDNREDGSNGGRTSFIAGDNVGILLFKSSNVSLLASLSSLGVLTNRGSVNIPVTGFATFGGEVEYSLPYPVSSGLGGSWLGANLGGVILLNESTLRLSQSAEALGSYFAGVYKYSYTSTAQLYELSGTYFTEPEGQILCYFAGAING